MDEKERLLKVFKNEEVDRVPVICPGGMMNAAITDILDQVLVNHNVEVMDMVNTARKIREEIGFENYGVPFCMTCEAEPLSKSIDEGDMYCEPRIMEYNDLPLREIMKSKINPQKDGRMPVVLEAIRRLKNDQVPVIGNITGPISTATSIVDPLRLLKMLRKQPDLAYEFIHYVNDFIIAYAIEMERAGADVIAVSDPTATGEILGKNNFEKFALPMYKELISQMNRRDTPVILHICGNATTILESLDTLDVAALSFDSIVNMRLAKSKIHTKLMGNISTQLLQNGPQDRILRLTENALNSGVDILSPACGLDMSTPIENLKSMTAFAKEQQVWGH